MKKVFVSTVLFTVLAAATGCSFAARSPEMYRDDTAKLLDSKAPDIKACYDQQLQGNSAAAGSVRVQFMVQKDTGQVADVKVDPAGTTAPPEVADCVVQNISGLQLTPPDQNDGQATFTWDFVVEPPAAAPPAEPAPAT